MKLQFAHFISKRRNFFAVAMLCVLIIKGLSYLGMAASIAKYPEAANQYFSAVVIGAHCDRDKSDGGQGQTRAHHEECCVLCASYSSRDVNSSDNMSLGAVIEVYSPKFEGRPLPYKFSQQGILIVDEIGLFSGWSPTAPPTA